MLVSVRWLKRIFPNDLSVADLVDRLNNAGLEVEETRDLGMGAGRLVTARVMEVRKHPQADRLSLVKADVGNGTTANIVCGAPNVREGMLVPCALPGAVMPGGMEIRKTKIRGEASEGMLCSARELGVGSDHAGILELPDAFEVGEPFDAIIDLGVTPNRPDCLSIMGVARELAAVLRKPIPAVDASLKETLEPVGGYVAVEVEAPEACPRYTCRYMEGAAIGPSPKWMQLALEASGIRAINNAVDATNYALLELGHPLHAFDFDTLRGGKIVVRFARAGERLVTLDDRELELHEDDLVIADAERPIALAGVMGGKETEITEKTRRIAIECAYFDPRVVRRSARRHGISTESSFRFERGTDRIGLELSLHRTAKLLQETGGGGIARGFLDVHAPLPEPTVVELDPARANRLIGIDLPEREMTETLDHLGFKVSRNGGGRMRVVPPSWRVDVALEEDLIEEIARIHGYADIPETLPAVSAKKALAESDGGDDVYRAKTIMVGLGFSEAVHYGMIGEDLARRFGFKPEEQPHLANPISLDQAVMRPSLMPELVATAIFNRRQGAEYAALFEAGKIFKPKARPGEQQDEPMRLGVAMSGTASSNWAQTPRPCDFFELKGKLEALGERLGLGALAAKPIEEPHPSAWWTKESLHPGRSALAFWQGEAIGVFGELHPDLAEALDARDRIYIAELDLDLMLALARRRTPRFAPIPKFPASERDLAVVVADELQAVELAETAREAAREFLEDLRIVDVYKGGHIPEGKKSLALRFRLRSPERTLTDEEINAVMAKIQSALEGRCGAQLRG